MRTRLLVVFAVAALVFGGGPGIASATTTASDTATVSLDGGADDVRRLSLAGHLQADLIGLAVGPRLELLYRLGDPDGGENLRLSVGVLPGPELVHVPLAVGYRQCFDLGDVAQLGLGLGFELQSFFVPDHYAVVRPAFYAEFVLDFKVMDNGWIGVHTGADVAPFDYFGFGIMTRLGFRWDFGG